MWESKSYQTHEDHMTLYEALEKSMAQDNSDQLLFDLAEARKNKKKRQAHLKHHLALHLILLLHHQQVPLELQEPLALLGHFNHHLLLHLHPKIRVSWWKPLTEDRPATPEPAWSIPSSDLTVLTHNWASALKSTYTPLPENSLLA
ncbi:hypothetical protein Tco_0674259 [Tanacetum coccineum]